MTVLAREKLPVGRMLERGQAPARRPGRETRAWCGARERAEAGGVRWQPTLQEEVPGGPEDRGWPGADRGGGGDRGPPVLVAGAAGPGRAAGAGAAGVYPRAPGAGR